MKINFVTSGFPNGFTDEFTEEVKKYLSSNNSFVFVASDFAVHDRTNIYLDIFLKYFSDKDINFKEANIIDYKVTPAEAVSLIEKSDVVWLSGGPTLVQIRCIKEYGLIDALQKRNGITIGMSAGSINMAKKVVLAKDLNDNVTELSLYDGIGLVDFNIEPHLNTASKEHYNDVEIAAKVSPIYGLHDNAFIEDIDGSFKVFGQYNLFE